MFPIFMVGGVKGGVGKTLLTMALTDYFVQLGKDCFLIETDTGNDDFFKAYGDTYPCQMVDLDKVDGWIDLINLCDEHRDKIFIVNGAARSNAGTGQYGENLRGVLKDLNRSLVTFWAINLEIDSVQLLRAYMDVMQGTTIHVVRNGFFGNENEFGKYNDSKTRKLIEDAGGKSLFMSVLAKRVTTVLYSERKSIDLALSEMPLGNKAELLRWQGECKKMFDGAIGKL
jgi:hypothetical protein